MHAQDEPVRPVFTGEVPTGITVDTLRKGQDACPYPLDGRPRLPGVDTDDARAGRLLSRETGVELIRALHNQV